jgi:hypothetical protein
VWIVFALGSSGIQQFGKAVVIGQLPSVRDGSEAVLNSTSPFIGRPTPDELVDPALAAGPKLVAALQPTDDTPAQSQIFDDPELNNQQSTTLAGGEQPTPWGKRSNQRPFSVAVTGFNLNESAPDTQGLGQRSVAPHPRFSFSLSFSLSFFWSWGGHMGPNRQVNAVYIVRRKKPQRDNPQALSAPTSLCRMPLLEDATKKANFLKSGSDNFIHCGNQLDSQHASPATMALPRFTTEQTPAPAVGQQWGTVKLYVATHRFEAVMAEQLSFEKGELFTVQERLPNGWWRGTVLSSGEVSPQSLLRV